MKTLILMRHAKSDWDHPGLPDAERPLNRRGRMAAGEIGAWLDSRGLVPQVALVSAAVRTRETWEKVAERLPGAPEAKFLPELYHASPAVMLGALRTHGGRAGRVMMVGHNPGIAALAGELLARAASHPDYARYPTGATAVIEFGTDWADVAPGTGGLVEFALPRELID
jgi:phosphohistidine phosphatase